MEINVLTIYAFVLLVPSFLGFNLNVLHTNDIHAHFEESNVGGSQCLSKESLKGKCFGGYPRLVTIVKEYRALHPNNTIVLDAGDQFQGTPWFYFFDGNVTAKFVNILGYDAMSLGNHEFDSKVDGLVSFIKEIEVPIVSSNLDASQEPSLRGLIHKSIVVQVGRERIGIIGYITTNTPSLSLTTGKLKFKPIIESVQKEVAKLKNKGINKIIALGHAGFQFDQVLAKEVEGLDIVVGGHSHTFLYTGSPPSTETATGAYPTIVQQAGGTQVPVVQAYCNSKYIGRIELQFDEQGRVVAWAGRPLLLDSRIPQDAETLEMMAPWSAELKKLTDQKLGNTSVFLQGDEHNCRRAECNLGNAYTDAMLRAFQKFETPDSRHWTTAAIALVTGGGIRSSINIGVITTGDILSSAPFRNDLCRIKLRGAFLLEALEHSVSNYPTSEADDIIGGFLQVSGLLITYDVIKPPGSRVVEVLVRCANCSVPMYAPLNVDMFYVIVIPVFTAFGGDGYTMIRDNMIRIPSANLFDTDVLADYVKDLTPITIGIENRIRILNVRSDEDT